MLLKNIYQNLDTYVNQDGTDDYYGVDDFNRLIRDELRNFVLDVIKEEMDNPPNKRAMHDYLLDSLSNTDGEEALPSDYLNPVSAEWVPTSGAVEKIDIISKSEFIRRKSDMLSPPQEENQICYIEDGNVYFKQDFSSGGTAYLYFTRDPVVDTVGSEAPFLDYYMNTDDDLTFLDVGDDLNTQGAGTYRNGTTMPFFGTAATHELDIPEEFHIRFYERFIERLGAKDRDVTQIQYGMGKEQQESVNN